VSLGSHIHSLTNEPAHGLGLGLRSEHGHAEFQDFEVAVEEHTNTVLHQLSAEPIVAPFVLLKLVRKQYGPFPGGS